MTSGLTALLPASGAATTDAAARCLREGGLVAFPTETVYGLGADAGNAAAIARLDPDRLVCDAAERRG